VIIHSKRSKISRSGIYKNRKGKSPALCPKETKNQKPKKKAHEPANVPQPMREQPV
jgi:hypothetical protein